MIIDIEKFLSFNDNVPIIDVRSPSEYAKGHIVNAINIPLFTDDERAEVGTAYKQSGKKSALFIGLDKVGLKMSLFLKKALALSQENHQLRVYCWRGGMRSQSMAWLFEQGEIETFVLEGGYKNFRNFIREEWSNQNSLMVLGGMTGSGKTEILHEMRQMGEQVLDLEHEAHHKGSAFGAIGQDKQLTNEQFENNLYHTWKDFSQDKVVWLEDESRSIGSNSIPDPLYKKMRDSKVIQIILDKKLRIKRLVKEYADVDDDLIIGALHRINKKIGMQHEKEALKALEQNDYESVAEISLSYYDKAYLRGLSKRGQNTVFTLELKEDNPPLNAMKIIDYSRRLLDE